MLPIKVFWPLVALWETGAFTHQHCHEPALIDRARAHVCARIADLCGILPWDLRDMTICVWGKILFLTSARTCMFKIRACKRMSNIIQ